MRVSNGLALVTFIPWGLFFVWSLSLFYGQSRSRVRALMDAAVLQAAAAVAVAEITSLFTAYHWIWVGLSWTILALLAGALHLKRQNSLRPCKGFLQSRPALSKQEKQLLWLMLGTVGFALFKIFLSPPNAPTDSIQYHMPRTFMYYKNQSIHGYATSYGHMLYFGPLNAILMSQGQIMSGGWDRLYPFVQFTAYLLTMLAVYQITLLFCKKRSFALIGAAMVCFMPMAHLQASTTQSDLLVTCFCAVSVHSMAQMWSELTRGNKPSLQSFAMLGISCGLAVLSKLSAGVTLVCFALSFAAFLWIKLRKGAFRRLLVILLCVVLVAGGFWTRNALDWRGDFLPMGYSGARPDYGELGIRGTLLISAKALATTISSPHRDLPRFLAMPSYWAAQGAAALVQMDLDNPLTTESDLYSGTVHLMPDDISYPFHAILILGAFVFCLAFSLRKKKWALFIYTLCCLASILIASTQYVWCTSVNRYLCPSVVLAIPLAAYMLGRLCQKRRGWRTFGIVFLLLMFLYNAACSAVHPIKDIIEYKQYGFSYEERLIRGMDPSAYDYWRQVSADMKESGYQRIAFDSQTVNGDYFWMRGFTAPEFEVRYINPILRPDLEAAEFVPDCIIGSYDRDMAPETLEYHGVRYTRKFPVTCIFWPQEYSLRVMAYYVKEGPL